MKLSRIISVNQDSTRSSFFKGVNMTENEEKLSELGREIESIDQRGKCNTHRIDALEEEVKENRKILSTIERLASEINANTQETKSLREDVNSIGDRMNKLEQENISEDADKWKQFVSYIFMTFVGIVIAVVAQKIGLK